MRFALLSVAVILAVVAAVAAFQFWNNLSTTQQAAVAAPPPVVSQAPSPALSPVPSPAPSVIANAQAADAPAIALPATHAAAENAASLAAKLPAGMRAVPILLGSSGSMITYIAVGDRVDVLFTSLGQGEKPIMTEVLLPNVRVLAVKAAEKDVTSGSVAVEATEAQAQKLVLAGKAGKLSLVLRSSADKDDESVSRPLSLDSLIHTQVAASHMTSPDDGVRIIRGTGKQDRE